MRQARSWGSPGSSPPARGARTPPVAHVLGLRIIPACAGSTSRWRATGSRATDHPRLRGEHPASNCEVKPWRGSSPPARGAPRFVARPCPHLRIIPACAGSTTIRIARTRSTRDHPRLRGEHNDADLHEREYAGSSPPARGARRRRAQVGEGARIIPACAGSTSRATACRGRRTDHPRLRGEHLTGGLYQTVSAGSSPPARGARGHTLRRDAGRGIIPACAGSTRTYPPPAARSRDHPRLRGEHWSRSRPKSSRSGSSPPARGARLCALSGRYEPRIIPACAGSTSTAT